MVLVKKLQKAILEWTLHIFFFSQLHKFISQQLQNMSTHRPAEMDLLDQNLFVDAAFSEVVKKNFDEVNAHLKQLQLNLEQLHFAYTNI